MLHELNFLRKVAGGGSGSRFDSDRQAYPFFMRGRSGPSLIDTRLRNAGEQGFSDAG